MPASPKLPRNKLALFLLLASLSATVPALSQTGEAKKPESVAPPELGWFRQHLTLPEPELASSEERLLEDAKLGLREAQRGSWPAPASSVATPAGYGAQWTEVFFGANIQNRPRFRKKANGTAFAGFGLGDPRRFLGGEIAVGLYGLIPPGERGGLNVKVHRILPGDIGIALGLDNLFVWGGADAKPAHYLAVSKTFNLRDSVFLPLSQLTLHAGLGDGGYRSEADIFAERNTFGWFAAAGLRVLAPVGLIANWSGQDLFAGLSLTPSSKYPFILTFTAQDLLHRAGDGIRFSMGISYSESIWRLPLLN